MKILGNLIKILLFLLLLFVLVQNAEEKIDLQIFKLYWEQIHVSIVLLITLGIGAISGATLISFSILHLRSDLRSLQRKNKQLNRELENLRNISVDEIPVDEIDENVDDKS